MARSPLSSAYWDGFRKGLPFLLIVAPFGALFGVLATEAGLQVFETMTFSMTVFAGAAQLTAIQMLNEGAPTAVALASALAVNLRMAMYSASLTPYLGAAPLWQRAFIAYFTVDQSYALSIAHYETSPEMSLAARIRFFFGTMTPIVPAWYASSLAGAVLGAQIPESWALDFALPITFLAIAAPMLRTLAHVAAAFVAVAVALLAAGLPFNLGLIVGGISGMMAGARVEVMLREKGLWDER
ncbi:AzlC family ABC transporter permease [Phaeobacter marinintestinus]|uniref:AzlC family ABC transporter permease n=1 Tax=Falsiphaeobacter marinintestinus TaxID=1492905 RepID=UPI0011B5E619|nr:AzlC family ABC transporter permease [Phaeobacter marinintestinus]